MPNRSPSSRRPEAQRALMQHQHLISASLNHAPATDADDDPPFLSIPPSPQHRVGTSRESDEDGATDEGHDRDDEATDGAVTDGGGRNG